MRSFFHLALTILITVACNSKTASVTSGKANAEAPFIWESGFPKSIALSTEYSTQPERDKINESLAAWETGLNNYNFFQDGGTTAELFNVVYGSMPNIRDNQFVIYKATKWPYPQYPDALAITQIFAIRYNVGDSDEYVSIQEADVIMNYEDFSFDGGGFSYDFRTVLVHELGHFLGLQHKPRSYNRDNTVMYPSIFSYEEKRTPLTVDIQDLAGKYSITLPLSSQNSAIASERPVYRKKPGDPGAATVYILELRANGMCVHHRDGVTVSRHPAGEKH